jgi:hypothetical protein
MGEKRDKMPPPPPVTTTTQIAQVSVQPVEIKTITVEIKTFPASIIHKQR